MKTIYSKKIPVLVLFLTVIILSVPLFSSQAVVELGLAGNLVILAESGVTNVPTSVITGNVGVSPGTSITGFAETLSGDGTYATSEEIVEGKIFTSVMTEPTPSLLTQAVLDMHAAYTDASTRTGPVYEAGIGVLDNTVLAEGPGLYQWTGGVSITGDITISGAPDAVWIFQTAGVLDLAVNAKISLAGGAQAKNIFWVTAGGASLLAGSHTIGNILSMETIAFGANASLKGKALSWKDVTLIMNTIDYCSTVPTTLPVTLSSFTAGTTVAGMVMLQWTTETETNLLGYNVYRNDDNVLAEAAAINPVIIPAKNSSVTTYYNFTDESVIPGSTYYYWLQSMDSDLTNRFHGPISIQVNEDGGDGTINPSELTTRLIGAYPNPFNPGTYINFSLAEEGKVTITIYNNRGQLIKNLTTDQSFDKGRNHSVYWDGKDSRGNDVGSGVYLYIMETKDNYSSQKKMILVK